MLIRIPTVYSALFVKSSALRLGHAHVPPLQPGSESCGIGAKPCQLREATTRFMCVCMCLANVGFHDRDYGCPARGIRARAHLIPISVEYEAHRQNPFLEELHQFRERWLNISVCDECWSCTISDSVVPSPISEEGAKCQL